MAASEIISKYACRYDLTKGDMETLMANIDRYEDSGIVESEENTESDLLSSVKSPEKGEPEWVQDINRLSLQTEPKLEDEE